MKGRRVNGRWRDWRDDPKLDGHRSCLPHFSLESAGMRLAWVKTGLFQALDVRVLARVLCEVAASPVAPLIWYLPTIGDCDSCGEFISARAAWAMRTRDVLSELMETHRRARWHVFHDPATQAAFDRRTFNRLCVFERYSSFCRYELRDLYPGESDDESALDVPTSDLEIQTVPSAEFVALCQRMSRVVAEFTRVTRGEAGARVPRRPNKGRRVSLWVSAIQPRVWSSYRATKQMPDVRWEGGVTGGWPVCTLRVQIQHVPVWKLDPDQVLLVKARQFTDLHEMTGAEIRQFMKDHHSAWCSEDDQFREEYIYDSYIHGPSDEVAIEPAEYRYGKDSDGGRAYRRLCAVRRSVVAVVSLQTSSSSWMSVIASGEASPVFRSVFRIPRNAAANGRRLYASYHARGVCVFRGRGGGGGVSRARG